MYGIHISIVNRDDLVQVLCLLQVLFEFNSSAVQNLSNAKVDQILKMVTIYTISFKPYSSVQMFSISDWIELGLGETYRPTVAS